MQRPNRLLAAGRKGLRARESQLGGPRVMVWAAGWDTVSLWLSFWGRGWKEEEREVRVDLSVQCMC